MPAKRDPSLIGRLTIGWRCAPRPDCGLPGRPYSQSVTPTQLSQPTKTIPQRINQEILVRGADILADLAKRTPAEIIQVINQASAKKGAIVARKLPSGDIVVTFSDPTTKE